MKQPNLLKTIHTERLIIRPFENGDAGGLFTVDSLPEVVKYIGLPTTKTVEESAGYVNMILQQYDDHGMGRMAVIDKITGRFTGWCGIKYYNETINGKSNFYELGYRFHPDFWGKGIATEAAHAVVEDAFAHPQIDHLVAMANRKNGGSINVLKKLNFNEIESFSYMGMDVAWLEANRQD